MGPGSHDAALNLNQRVKAAAMARGVMICPGAGCINRRRGDHILPAPPDIVTRAGVDKIGSRLDDAVDAVFAERC